jgi:hypothetical protein
MEQATNTPLPASVAAPIAPSPASPSAAPTSAPAPAPTAPPSEAVVPPRPPIDERILVTQAIQRYRSAYERLDASSAQAVWPKVNRAALARAFDALASQAITFDNCDVRLQAPNAATAICRGYVSYVPRVGSREPRIESRVWDFSLRKGGTEWTIDTARVDR